MNKKFRHKSIIFIATLLLICKGAEAQDVYNTVMNRIYENISYVSSISTHDATVKTDMASMVNKDSCWSDINYKNDNGVHLGRVQSFALAYAKTSSTFYKNADLYRRIENALAYWCQRRPTNTNWWYNVISYPQQIGQILILMRYGSKKIPAALETRLINLMRQKIKSGDGANTNDVAMHYMYRACLTKNAAAMDSAATYSFEGISYLFKEGLNIDNSFTAHGPQLYIHGYGQIFTSNAYRATAYLAGTQYAISPSKLAMLNNFYKNTCLAVSRNGYNAFNAQGRGISRGSGLAHNRSKGISNFYLSYARMADPSNAATWDSIARGTYQNRPTHSYYWKGDYTLHIRPGYSFNVRTVSERTKRTEMGNGENLYGKFLPDGATAIQRIGSEYQNIFPIWEWDKIPGTTSRDFANDAGAKISINWGEQGSTAFTGGVSDGLYGASVYTMNYNSVAAKKAWFYFDKEVVCLGAGITSNQPESITTSVNQSWLYGDIKIGSGGSFTTIDSKANKAITYTNPTWILHDTIGYFFPAVTSVTVSNKLQTGSWNKINITRPTTSLSEAVFNTWINHGVSPTNASYAYIVVPGLGTPSEMQNYPIAGISIIANTENIQAVWHKQLDMMQVVFYKAATLASNGITLTVDKPCVLLLKNVSSKRVRLHIADPAQLYQNVKLTFTLPGISGGIKNKMLNLPTGSYAGSSTLYILDDATLSNPDKLPVIADAYVKSGSTNVNTNFGKTSYLVAQNGYYETYLKFDARNVYGYVSDAKLRLYAISTLATEWRLYKVSDNSWTDTGITWNNKPAAETLLATIKAPATTGYVYWDVSNLLLNIPADGYIGLKIVATANSYTAFSSKENSTADQRPCIILNNTPPKTEIVDVNADAFVKGGAANANTNFGRNSYLTSQNGYYETYLKFNLRKVKGKVLDAKLRLYSLASAATNWQLYKVNNNKWSEYDITWNTKPNANEFLTTIPAPNIPGYVYFDLTSQVKNPGTDSILTVKVVATAGVYSSFASRESGSADQRPIITYIADTSPTIPATKNTVATNSEESESQTEGDLLKSQTQSEIKVYPNPVTNSCVACATNDIKRIIIYNAAGNVIKRIDGIDAKQHVIEMSNFGAGLYLLLARGDNWSATTVIVKQ